MTIEEHNAAIVYDDVKLCLRKLAYLTESEALSPVDKRRVMMNVESLRVTLRNLEGSFPSIGDY